MVQQRRGHVGLSQLKGLLHNPSVEPTCPPFSISGTLQPDEPEFFFTDMDNPWSPCVSRDGKTIALIVDSRTRGKGPRAGIERKSSVGK